MRQISTLLVANRGEIALRVMKTARRMGIATVAVFSEADTGAPHVKFADKALCIGPAPVGESYLRQDRIIQAALKAGADAIHPGYGFLSENESFAEATERAGIIFVGPPVKAISVMGDKARSKRAMIEAGIPCVPGYEGVDQSEDVLVAEANRIGYPVMVKASAGGGGRGMRLVRDAGSVAASLRLARSEAQNAFGNGDLIIEKAIIRPRHVELQIFCDAHGTAVYLGERDCSVQRRHQKVLEEAPCPVMTPVLRARMGEAAVAAARAVDYRGAGTVEFLLDANGSFYFLEMNTRLQVEHPVTEMVTGLDLVELQIRVAQGLPLGLRQEDVELKGHAIEARLYAEDAGNDFLPSTGRISRWAEPQGVGVRVDSGVETGSEVSPFYDAMVAKVIAWGETRDDARRRLSRAVEELTLFGPKSNQSFLKDAINRPPFIAGEATTAFIAETYGEEGYRTPPLTPEILAAAAVIQHGCARRAAQRAALFVPDELMDWSGTASRASVAEYLAGEELTSVRVLPARGGSYHVVVGDAVLQVEPVRLGATHATLAIAGDERGFEYLDDGEGAIFLKSGATTFHLMNEARRLSAGEDDDKGGIIRAPMHGSVIDLFVAEGDRVSAGDRMLVLEAMKMQHEITARAAGVVRQVNCAVGAQMAADDVLVTIEVEQGG